MECLGKECWSSSTLAQCTRRKYIPLSDVGKSDGILGDKVQWEKSKTADC